MHLDEQLQIAEDMVRRVSISETINILEEGNCIKRMKKLMKGNNSDDGKDGLYLESIDSMKELAILSIEECINISKGKPLLTLLQNYGKLIKNYALKLLKVIYKSNVDNNLLKYGRMRKHSNAILHVLKKWQLKKPVFQNRNDDYKDPNESPNVGKAARKEWSDFQAENFVIYVCMVYNTSVEARRLLRTLIGYAKNLLEEQFRYSCTHLLC